MSELALKLIAENKKTKSKKLDLGNCGLTELPDELFECIWLEELMLSDFWVDYQVFILINSKNHGMRNSLKEVPIKIGSLVKLKKLIIRGNAHERWGIADIKFLGSLENLQYLDLSGNQISDISFLKHLTDLQSLNLSYNQISDIIFLENLTCLQVLVLSENQISDCRFLGKLTCLETLLLSSNKIGNIDFLNELTSLKNLWLDHNLISDITILGKLTDLQYVGLHENIIHELPLSFLKTTKLNIKIKKEDSRIKSISLYGNNIENVPMYVLKQGRDFIIKYLESKGKLPLNECKVIITGRGESGKTSLQKRLFGKEKFSANESETHGIRKRSWENGIKYGRKQVVKVHFWDMGGQKEQQTLHELFYTGNTLYILLLDKRKDEHPEEFLELIKVYGKNCPVIIVINHKKDLKKKGKIEYELKPGFDSALRSKYPNIVDTFGVCCGQANDPGINNLRTFLKQFIPSLQHVNESYPAEWLQIKDELIQKVDKNYIQFHEFEEMCKERNVNTKEFQVGLAKMLNDTGAITYFDDPDLNLYILNPDWVTTGAYAIMLSSITARKKGRINFEDVKTILSNSELSFKYENNDYTFLMKLLMAYKLCHEFEKGKEWLIPSSLYEQSLTDLVEYRKNNDYRLYCLKYETTLPQSIIHRFIASNIDYALNEDYWRHGILLKHPDSETYMYAEADYNEREIRLWIRGSKIPETWNFFRKDFTKFSKNYVYEEKVAIEENSNLMISYKVLTNLSNKKIEDYYYADFDMNINVPEILGYIKTNEEEKPFIEEMVSLKDNIAKPIEIFFSYAWGGESEILMDKLYNELKAEGYNVLKDKDDLGYKGIISDFMKRIGEGEFVIVAISDKYLRSEYCMDEFYQIYINSKMDKHEMADKIFPIKAEEVKLGNSDTEDVYLELWANKMKDAKARLKKMVGTRDTTKLNIRYERINDINNKYDNLLDIIKDINHETKELLSANNFEKIKAAIKKRIEELE